MQKVEELKQAVKSLHKMEKEFNALCENGGWTKGKGYTEKGKKKAIELSDEYGKFITVWGEDVLVTFRLSCALQTRLKKCLVAYKRNTRKTVKSN